MDGARTSFGERLKKLRAAAGLTQEQLSDRSGIAREHIAHYEGGQTPQGANLMRLATGLGVSVDKLLKGVQFARRRRRAARAGGKPQRSLA